MNETTSDPKLPPPTTSACLNAISIGHNILEAIAAFEMYEPVAKNADLFEHINRAGIGNGFMFMRATVYHALLLSLCRIWDEGADKDGLKSLLNKLKGSELQIALQKQEKFNTKRIEALWAQYRQIRKSDAFKAVVGARNKRIAHTEARFLSHPTTPATPLQIGHERELIELTIPIAYETSALVGHQITPYTEFRRSWHEYSTRFWRQLWPEFRCAADYDTAHTRA